MGTNDYATNVDELPNVNANTVNTVNVNVNTAPSTTSEDSSALQVGL